MVKGTILYLVDIDLSILRLGVESEMVRLELRSLAFRNYCDFGSSITKAAATTVSGTTAAASSEATAVVSSTTAASSTVTVATATTFVTVAAIATTALARTTLSVATCTRSVGILHLAAFCLFFATDVFRVILKVDAAVPLSAVLGVVTSGSATLVEVIIAAGHLGSSLSFRNYFGHLRLSLI